MHAFLGVAFWTVIKNTYVHATLKENRDSCVVLLIMCKKPTFLSTFAEGLGLFPVKGFVTFGQMLYTVKACACTRSKGLSLVGRCCTLWSPGSVPCQGVCHSCTEYRSWTLWLSQYLLLRSKFLAPAVICVVIFVSIFTVWRLLVSLEIITLCHWLSLSGLFELPLMRLAPFPKSNT